MKKILSLLMVLALFVSLTGTMFATENADGAITITNATIGDDYTLYKIFDATYSVDAANNVDAVSYSISQTRLDENGNEVPNEVFVAMFGADGKQANTYFEYDSATGQVKRKDNTLKEDIISYLTELVRTEENNIPSHCPSVTADSELVSFTNLPYAYYLIDKGVDTFVTITSNTPTVNVIDKNQTPAPEDSFKKTIWDEDKEEWVQETSSHIGDIITYKVEFVATNYDGEHPVKYYTIKDTKGDAVWVEFNSFTVKVIAGPDEDDVIVLEKGYYWGVEGTHNTGEWKYFGPWTEEEKADINNADWFMVHRGYDEFDIVIPWLSDYTFVGTPNDFQLTFGENATSLYESPVDVEITYTATIEPNATIGGASNDNNLWNRVDLSWTSNRTSGPDEESVVTTKVYALGLTKIDSETNEHLAGAEFELYSDADCKNPVYVIPTDVKGVYILDDFKTNVTGIRREKSREKYRAYLAAYLGDDYETTGIQKNVVTTEANGKIVVLGLEEGDYYLKEVKAPDGYNKLQDSASVDVGTKTHQFSVVVDQNGNVVDSEFAEGTNVKHTYICTTTTVENSKGTMLPSTGGEGTKMLLMIGFVTAMIFAVLLITHKKMTVYQD